MGESNRIRRGIAVVWLAILCLAAFGCGPPFDPVARLTNLRVLAIRADPVNPAPGQPTTLDALVYTPPAAAGQTLAASWSWCPLLGNPNSGYGCPITDAQLQAMAAGWGLSGIPPLTLGTEQTQAFSNPFPTALLADLCNNGFTGTPADCQGGFPIRVNLAVSFAGVERTATTVLRLPVVDDAPANTNPRFDAAGPALGALLDGVEQPIDGLPQGLPAGSQQASVTLPRLKETDLRAHVADAEAESYPGHDDNDNPAVLREQLVLSWYVETGDVALDAFHTGYFPGQTEIEQFLSNKWKPGSKASYPADQARVILVLRDNRGGVNWTSGSVNLEPTP